jgi:hypothetical protein
MRICVKFFVVQALIRFTALGDAKCIAGHASRLSQTGHNSVSLALHCLSRLIGFGSGFPRVMASRHQQAAGSKKIPPFNQKRLAGTVLMLFHHALQAD